jgi:hypothetical protein
MTYVSSNLFVVLNENLMLLNGSNIIAERWKPNFHSCRLFGNILCVVNSFGMLILI